MQSGDGPMSRGMGTIEAHVEWCRLRNLRTATLVARRNTLNRVDRMIQPPLNVASADDLYGWWAALTAAPDARATDLSHVRQYFKWLHRDGHRIDDPTVRLIRPRLRRRLPRPIDETDLAIALAGARDRVRPWFMLAAFCGLRAGEIAGLRAEDILDTPDGRAVFIADGKSITQRVVPIHCEVLASLGPRGRGHLFRTVDGRPIPAHLVSHHANAELRALGIDATLHQFRHRYATQIYRLSLDLRLTQDLLGHSSPITTSRYAAWSPGAARTVTDQLVGQLTA